MPSYTFDDEHDEQQEQQFHRDENDAIERQATPGGLGHFDAATSSVFHAIDGARVLAQKEPAKATPQQAVVILKADAETRIATLLNNDRLQVLRDINTKVASTDILKSGVALQEGQSHFGYLLANYPKARKGFFNVAAYGPSSPKYNNVILTLTLLTPKDYEILFREHFDELRTNRPLWTMIKTIVEPERVLTGETHIARAIQQLPGAPQKRTLFSFLIKSVFSNPGNISVLLSMGQGLGISEGKSTNISSDQIVSLSSIADATMLEKLFTPENINQHFGLFKESLILSKVDARVLTLLLNTNREEIITSLNTMSVLTAPMYEVLIFSNCGLKHNVPAENMLKSKILNGTSSISFWKYVNTNCDSILKDKNKLIILRDILHSNPQLLSNLDEGVISEIRKTETTVSLSELYDERGYQNVTQAINNAESFLARTIAPLGGRTTTVKKQSEAPWTGWLHFMTTKKEKKLTTIDNAIIEIKECYEQYKDQGRVVLRSVAQGEGLDLNVRLKDMHKEFILAVNEIVTKPDLETALNDHRHLHRGHVLHSPTKSMDALVDVRSVVNAEMMSYGISIEVAEPRTSRSSSSNNSN